MISTRKAIVLSGWLVIVATSLLIGCGGFYEQPSYLSVDAVSMDSQNWDIQFSPTMPSHPSASSDGGWKFDFPACDGVHYVTTGFRQTAPHKAVKVTFNVVSAGASFVPVELSECPQFPARFRLYLERSGDDGSDGKRWWSNPQTFDLGSNNNSIVTMTVPLTPDNWSGLWGKMANSDSGQTAAFNNTLADLGRVGLTFGSCHAGHGVYAEGQASFEMLAFEVI
jgi:hypothetical protein